MSQKHCVLCQQDGGQTVWHDDALRVVLPDEPDFPGFTRVIWNSHVREMTDLSTTQQQRLMNMVFAVERVQRQHLGPDKINLASLGNQVAHLHWHVIPRFTSDSHFPAPVWAPPQRTGTGLPDPGGLAIYSAALKKITA